MPRGTGFPARGFGTGRTLRPPPTVLSRPPSVFRRQPSHPILASFALLCGQPSAVRPQSSAVRPPPSAVRPLLRSGTPFTHHRPSPKAEEQNENHEPGKRNSPRQTTDDWPA